jgi:SAM-dependent methyltransferase
MLKLARRRLGDGADLQVADLSRPLPFSDGAFDDVIASLVLHYLEDWRPVLGELRRVLTPGGRLIVAVPHPFEVHTIELLAGRRPSSNYFSTHSYTEEWTMGSKTTPMSFWHRPLHAMTGAFAAAGFRISVISEPQPVPEARELDPDAFRMLSTNPSSLFFVLHADLRWRLGATSLRRLRVLDASCPIRRSSSTCLSRKKARSARRGTACGGGGCRSTAATGTSSSREWFPT